MSFANIVLMTTSEMEYDILMIKATPKEYEAHIWGYDVFAASRSEMRRVFAAA